MARSHRWAGNWKPYLSEFHATRPGITEDILSRTTSTVGNPYQWLIAAVPQDARVLDVACGSAPLRRYAPHKAWVGIDRSPAELQQARYKDITPVVLGDASQLPFHDHSIDAIVSAMALMLLDPLESCLAEMTRVLVAKGTIHVLLPGGPAPLRGSDLGRWAHLLSALRVARLQYPNARPMHRLAATSQRHGLQMVADERLRFTFHIPNAEVADRFVDSLYLPNTAPRRVTAARRVVRNWVGGEIGIPLRRVELIVADHR